MKGRVALNTFWKPLLGRMVAAFLVASCSSGRAIKYQSGDQNATPGTTIQWNFDGDSDGGLPTGATSFSGNWAVRSESDSPSSPNALCQTGEANYPALVLGETVYADVTVLTNFKPTSGKQDQAAGVIFRIQDKDNYYILRANALENNVNFYKYVDGTRSELKGGQAKVSSGQWQELRVEVAGSKMSGFLNGELVIEAIDSTFQVGKVGLWTKADSVTCFDNITAVVP